MNRKRTLLLLFVFAAAAAIGVLMLLRAGKARLASDLFDAIDRGDTSTVARLLDRGADPNARDRDGRTPLCVAAGGQWLSESTAEAASEWGEHRKCAPTVRLLMQHGADPRLKDRHGRTPLQVAESSAEGWRSAGDRAYDAVKDDFEEIIRLLSSPAAGRHRSSGCGR